MLQMQFLLQYSRKTITYAYSGASMRAKSGKLTAITDDYLCL